jgi:hypothetical protein
VNFLARDLVAVFAYTTNRGKTGTVLFPNMFSKTSWVVKLSTGHTHVYKPEELMLIYREDIDFKESVVRGEL